MSKFNHTITVAEAKRSVDRIWLTQAEAAAYLGISPKTISRLRESGRLSFYRLDRLVLIKKSDIDRMVEQGRVC